MAQSETESPNSKQKLRVHIRWMIRRDMPEVIAIESDGFEPPWTEENFIVRLCQRNCIGRVAEYDNRVVGFMIYELYQDRIRLLNFAVAGDYRRFGVGTQMAKELINRLQDRRTMITLMAVEKKIPDPCLSFFEKQGFSIQAKTVVLKYELPAPEDKKSIVEKGVHAPQYL